MKKLIISIGSILLLFGALVGCSAKADSANAPEKEVSENVNDDSNAKQEDEDGDKEVTETNDSKEVSKDDSTDSQSSDIQEFDEEKVLSQTFDVEKYNSQVKKDNDHKRVILFKDDHGNVAYKSVYVKDKDRLKIIDTDKGLVFNDVIKDNQNKQAKKKTASKSKDEPKQKSEDADQFKEYSVISKQIDTKQFNAKTVEDNQNKRILVFKDDNGQSKYKSIYIKHKNWLKIIDLNGGPIYNDTI